MIWASPTMDWGRVAVRNCHHVKIANSMHNDHNLIVPVLRERKKESMPYQRVGMKS